MIIRPSIAPGDVFAGRYEIRTRLGEGGFGSVYEATQRSTGQAVAVKVLDLERATSGDDADRRISRFLRELQLCGQLHHPNIVPLLDSGSTNDGALFAVFGLVPGENLASLLGRDGALAPREARHLMTQVLDALACAHGQGVVHRDLKPHNIMVTGTGGRRNAMVLDFGIGALVEEMRPDSFVAITATHEHLGTPAYAAPEQIRGTTPTPASDLYAWGLVFLECLTGKRVMQANSVAALLYQHLSPDPIAIPEGAAVQPFAPILRRALEKEAHARAQSAQELMHALDALDLATMATTHGPSATVSERVPAPSPSSPNAWSAGERRPLTAVSVALTLKDPLDDPETLEELLGEKRALVRHIAERFDAYLKTAAGDRMLLYFGLPKAREDDPKRAARAALELQLLTKRSPLGRKADLRLGIHSGLVVVRDQLGQPEVVGSPPGVASQLDTLAPRGGVVLSSATREQLGADFVLQPIEQPGEPQPAYLLLKEDPAARSNRHSRLALVGRRSELQQLDNAWQRAQTGKGTAILVVGEAGIGKSRLTEELRRRATPPFLWLDARSSSEQQNTALAPIIELLEQVMVLDPQLQEAERRARLEAWLLARGFTLPDALPLFLPLLGLSADPRYPPPDLAPQKLRERTLEAIANLVFEAASEQPVLFCLEDLHWADPSTIQLAGMLAKDAGTASLFVLFTARPDFVPPWSAADVTTLPLGRLEPQEIDVLAQQVAQTRYSPELAAQLIARTEGVPLFVEELARAATENSSATLSIPTTLLGSLTARLDRLGPARELAQLASVLGRSFSEELLLAVSNSADLGSQIEALVGADIWYRQRRLKAPGYTWKHALIQDAAYQSLLSPTRRSHHARVAEILTLRFPEQVQKQPELLAHHHSAAGNHRAAFDAWILAGQKALAGSNHQEALAHVRKAKQHLDALSGSEDAVTMELSLLGVMMPAIFATRGYAAPEALAALERARAIADLLPNIPPTFPLRWGLWASYTVSGRHREGTVMAEQLLQLAESANSSDLLLEAEVALGITHYYRVNLARARDHHLRAATLYEPSLHRGHAASYGQDPLVVSHCHRASTLWLMGCADQSLEALRKAEQAAAVVGQAHSHHYALGFHAVIRQFRRELPETEAAAARLVAEAQRHGHPFWLGIGVIIQSWAQTLRGELALSTLQAGVASYRATGAYSSLGYYLTLLAEAHLFSGDAVAAKAPLQEALELVRSRDECGYEPEILRLSGRTHLALGDSTIALSFFSEACETAQKRGLSYQGLRAATDWAQHLTPEVARNLLTHWLASIQEGHDTPDVKNAKNFLEQL